MAVNDGTTALHLALTALGTGHGDEVIVPDFTYMASANAVSDCGAKPLVGCEPRTSPGARLCGHAARGTVSFLGAGPPIRPKVSLGAYSKLSAGSVLTRSVGKAS
jgi:hypothetical protein